MMPPGHVAATWGVAGLLAKNNPGLLARLDYRLLAAAALLPDLLDKPLAILVFTDSHSSQNVGHSLLLHGLALVVTLLAWRRAVPYVLAFNGHLLADRMWHHTETFWWPFYGFDVFWQYKPMNTPGQMLDVYLDILTRYPQVWLVELIALGLLAWLGYRYNLYHWPALRTFILTGRTVANRTLPPAPGLLPKIPKNSLRSPQKRV